MKDIFTMGIEAVLQNYRNDLFYKKEDAINDMKTIIDKHCINRKEIEKRIDEIVEKYKQERRELESKYHIDDFYCNPQTGRDLILTGSITTLINDVKEMLK